MELKFKDIKEMQEYFCESDKNRDEIFTSLFLCLQKGILNKEDSVPFANIEFETGSSMQLNCEKEDFNLILNNCLSYFEDAEKYERCAEVLKLIERAKLY